ncbi:hypothetical protein LOAG_18478 [Loa loa]|uniref:Nucleotidyltransferase n=1 Tax=Loa loa TaxID=7209 RepID=A0A1I7VCM5_LOALO|nr:hypothetical protein LOAG_18478 [Loa loa]EJD74169.1 hypothetical protein LOAG_18478 [Loa loa]
MSAYRSPPFPGKCGKYRWYRECGIIPYTHDIDFTVFIEEYYNKFPEDVMNSSFIKLSLRFNRVSYSTALVSVRKGQINDELIG